MKHAGEKALDALGDLLEALGGLDGLREKKRGIFYRKSIAFLPFHEDPAGLFADLRAGSNFRRFPVNTRAQHKAFLAAVVSALDHG